MFSYYGSKSKIVHLYPKPKHDKIIEPFAGSARYSLRYFDHDVLLVDKYQVIVDVWHYLQQASEKDILGLPVLRRGQKISELSISGPEKDFLGFLAGVAGMSPRNTVSGFAAEQNSRPNQLKRIANQLYKIRHWTIIRADYRGIGNELATWFVDPPYQFGGQAYVEHNINYSALEYWIKRRAGQVIVCENTKATWLNVWPIASMRGAMTTTTEAIWCNEPHDFQSQQIRLFA